MSGEIAQSKTPNPKSTSRRNCSIFMDSSGLPNSEHRSRFEAYNRLQAAAVAFGEKLPIPEIVALGGQSDGKSSLLEALLGFRFNVREVEMGTRRPLILQMVHDPAALEPKCRFQEEDSEVYGDPVISASTIADIIKNRTDSHLKKAQAAVSAKPIIMRAEYAHCPNLTIIDTPGFILKAKKGEPESTPDEIHQMVRSLAGPPNRLLLFLQQSSVEWCSSLWLDAIREIDPNFRRTIIVVSKFDNRIKEFVDRWEVDRYLSASGYLGDNVHPFFVALPKERSSISNDDFRRQISHVDQEVVRHLRDNVNGGFNEERYGPFIGFGSLRAYLEMELQKRYKEAAPATLALLEQRCGEIAEELSCLDTKLQATSDVSRLRRLAMSNAASICSHVRALIDGAVDPCPEEWGRTTYEERSGSGIDSWPGLTENVKPVNASLKLFGGAAFERVIQEFHCASYSIECPPISREKVANILLAHAGRGGGRKAAEAAAEIARSAAQSWFSPLLDTACDRLAFVLHNLFDLALERKRIQSMKCGDHDGKASGDLSCYIGFHAALRKSYNGFVLGLSKQCKHLTRHHLNSVTSLYSQVCYDDNAFQGALAKTWTVRRLNQPIVSPLSLELESGPARSNFEDNQENFPPQINQPEHSTPGKASEGKEPLKESQLTVPETPSPDQPSDAHGCRKKENGSCNDGGGRKRQARFCVGKGNGDHLHHHQKMSSFCFGDVPKMGSAYDDICCYASQHFARIRDVLIEQRVLSTLNSSFLTPCQDTLVTEMFMDLFAVNDDKFMEMFVAPGLVDTLQDEHQVLLKRQKLLHSCLTEFKNIARAL